MYERKKMLYLLRKRTYGVELLKSPRELIPMRVSATVLCKKENTPVFQEEPREQEELSEDDGV